MRLLLIRHAEPVEVRGASSTPDPALSDRGRKQAANLADVLDGDRIDAIYVSPLRRALETADPLARRRDLEVVCDPELTELTMGENAYVPIGADRMSPAQLAVIDGWVASLASPPGRAAVREFRDRVHAACERIIAAHPGGAAAVVCHGGIINAVITEYLGVENLMVVWPAFTSITTVSASRSGFRGVVSINEHRHVRLADVSTASPASGPGGDR